MVKEGEHKRQCVEDTLAAYTLLVAQAQRDKSQTGERKADNNKDSDRE